MFPKGPLSMTDLHPFPLLFFVCFIFLCNPKPTEVKLNPLYISVADICALGNTAYELLAQLLQWAGGNRESLALTNMHTWLVRLCKTRCWTGMENSRQRGWVIPLWISTMQHRPAMANNALRQHHWELPQMAVCVHRAYAEGNDTIEIQLS